MARRLEYQISEQDVGKYVYTIATGNSQIKVNVDSCLPAADDTEKEAIRLGKSHVGKWLFVTLDVQSHAVTTSFHDQKK